MTFTTRPELQGTFGMVASTHWLGTAAGMAVLERGGNAFDAAVATGFTLQVVEPHLNGPGGDLPVVFWSAERGEPLVLCAQGVAPAAATIDRYRQLGHELVPGTGLLAACVPGAFGGWLRLLGEFGTWRLEDVLAFAIGYADEGYPVVPGITQTIERTEELLRTWEASAALYLPAPRPGALFCNRTLAATYRRIVEESRGGSREQELERARNLFYEGFVAEEIDRFSAEQGGLLTGSDLAVWEPTLESPATLDFRGLTVCKTGPWGQGPVFLQQLALLDGFDLAGAVGCRVRPRGGRVREARIRRPRSVLRRRRRPARTAPVARRTRTSGGGSWGTRRRTSCGPATAAGCPARSRRLRRSASASRPAATPFISTSPTASATSSPPRRAAAGSSRRR